MPLRSPDPPNERGHASPRLKWSEVSMGAWIQQAIRILGRLQSEVLNTFTNTQVEGFCKLQDMPLRSRPEKVAF